MPKSYYKYIELCVTCEYYVFYRVDRNTGDRIMKALIAILIFSAYPAFAGPSVSSGTEIAYIESLKQISEIMRDEEVMKACRRQWVKSIVETSNMPDRVSYQIQTTNCAITVVREKLETIDGGGRIITRVTSSECF